MTAQGRANRDGPLAHGRLPPAVAGRQADLAEHDVDHPVQEVALAGHVVVQRHRLDPEDLAELAHAEGADAAFVGEGDRGLEHLVAAQRRPPGRGVPGCRHPRSCLEVDITYTVSLLYLQCKSERRRDEDDTAAARPAEPAAAADQATMRAITQSRYGTVPEDVMRLDQVTRPGHRRRRGPRPGPGGRGGPGHLACDGGPAVPDAAAGLRVPRAAEPRCPGLTWRARLSRSARP